MESLYESSTKSSLGVLLWLLLLLLLLFTIVRVVVDRSLSSEYTFRSVSNRSSSRCSLECNAPFMNVETAELVQLWNSQCSAHYQVAIRTRSTDSMEKCTLYVLHKRIRDGQNSGGCRIGSTRKCSSSMTNSNSLHPPLFRLTSTSMNPCVQELSNNVCISTMRL